MIVPLAFDQIDGDRPQKAIAFLHGILGRGTNLRTLARKFVAARPEWSAWLIDLRAHGHSPKSSPNPSIEAAARDVIALAGHSELPLAAIAGHSFGGKVALETARLGETLPLKHIITIDSPAGRRDPLENGDSALALLRTIEALPSAFGSRADFANALERAGYSHQISQWLSTSMDKAGDGVRFGLDTSEIRALILDYFRRDMWQVVENPPKNVQMHIVIGDRSDSYSRADRERAAKLAAANPRVTVDILPAGHWVHIDDAECLLQTLLKRVE